MDITESGVTTSNCELQTDNLDHLENQWAHFVYTYSNTTNQTSIYINGELNSSADCDFDTLDTDAWILAGGNETMIGRESLDLNKAFTNDFDEIGIFDKPLTSSEVLQMYNVQENTYYWKVNASDASDSIDFPTWEFTIRCKCDSYSCNIFNDDCLLNRDIDLLGQNISCINSNLTFLGDVSNWGGDRELSSCLLRISGAKVST